MNTRLCLSLFLAFTFVLASAARSVAGPIPAAAAAAPAGAALPGATVQLQAGSHVAAFVPGRACLAALDHALCAEFVGGAMTTPMQGNPGGADRPSAPASPGSVRYAGLWPGVDVVYEPAEGAIAKATYYVAAGADPGAIRLRYNVPAAVQADGSLRFGLPPGGGALTESAPVAWQQIGGRRAPVAAAFVADGGTIGFRLGAYDPAYPLVIDPIYDWHTFYGNNRPVIQSAYAVAVDQDGFVYVAGSTGEPGVDSTDIAVIKIGPDGATAWEVDLGAAGMDDAALGLALDAGANVYVTGRSRTSWVGPGGETPLHEYTGGTSDIVVVKLDTDGLFVWHTFYGSGGDDGGCAVGLTQLEEVYVAFESDTSWNGDGGAEPFHAFSGLSGYYEMGVLKLSDDGSYQWHTFYGSSVYDSANALALDGSGNIYLGGASVASWQGDGGTEPLHAMTPGGDYELAVVKLNGDGMYQWHTFYGGSTGHTNAYGLAVDGAGQLYAVGDSNEDWAGDHSEAPLHQRSGDSDIMTLKLTINGAYQWHTYYGSTDYDVGQAVTVDGAGSVYIAGTSLADWVSGSGDEPLHAHTFSDDITLLKLHESGLYQWHTFYGGGSLDYARSVAVDGSGNIHVGGESQSTWLGDGGMGPIDPFDGFDNLMVLKLYGDVVDRVQAGEGTTLIYTDPQGLPTVVVVPPGALTGCFDLVFTPLYEPTHPMTNYAHHAWLLHAYPCNTRVFLPLVVKSGGGTRLTPAAGTPRSFEGRAPRRTGRPGPPAVAPGDPVFLLPATITVYYSDADVSGLDESQLELVYWNSVYWADLKDSCAPATTYVRNLAANWIQVGFCHMSQGGLRGR